MRPYMGYKTSTLAGGVEWLVCSAAAALRNACSLSPPRHAVLVAGWIHRWSMEAEAPRCGRKVRSRKSQSCSGFTSRCCAGRAGAVSAVVMEDMVDWAEDTPEAPAEPRAAVNGVAVVPTVPATLPATTRTIKRLAYAGGRVFLDLSLPGVCQNPGLHQRLRSRRGMQQCIGSIPQFGSDRGG